MSKQSSIEWLISHIAEDQTVKAKSQSEWLEIIEQAKAMHKEEMDKVAGDFWNEGASYMYDGKRRYKSFEEYYNETFEK